MSIQHILMGWSRVNAKIFYRMPDNPLLVNPNWFLWQDDDRAPDFPRLNAYLRWWDATLDGKLHSVQVWVQGLISPTELKHLGSEFRLS